MKKTFFRMRSIYAFLFSLSFTFLASGKEDFLIRGYEYAANEEDLKKYTENHDVVVVVSSVSPCSTCPLVAKKKNGGEEAAKKIARELKGDVALLYWPYDKSKEMAATLGFQPASDIEKRKNYSAFAFAYHPETSEILEEGALYALEASSRERRESVEEFITKVLKAKEELKSNEKEVVKKDEEEAEEVVTSEDDSSMVVESVSGKEIQITPLELSETDELKYLHDGKERTVPLSKLSEKSAEEVRAFFF